MIVGYQGMRGSHTERAATELLARAGIVGYRLDPCVTSAAVVRRLADRSIDLGALALRNAAGGEVAETVEAMRGVALREILRASLPIVHCLYARTPLDPAQVTAVYSHEQALRQCVASLRLHCPDATPVAAEDTALAARRLAQGDYPGAAAVLCSRGAGEQEGLCLIRAGMQDLADNLTEFALVGLAE
jgi:chorismate mutase/prephenate dehydratase